MLKKALLAFLALLFSFFIGCSGHSGITKGEWESIELEHYDYNYQKAIQLSSEEIEEITARLEYFHGFASGIWGFPDETKIDYYYFESRQEVKRLAGIDMNGKAVLEENRVLSVHSSDAHEISHIFTTPKERPLRLANFWMEGIAMYYTWPRLYYSGGKERLYERSLGAWYGFSVHQNAKKVLLEDNMPDLKELIYGNEIFGSLDSDISYPIAGSYVTFLIGEAHSDPVLVAKYRDFINKANIASTTDSVKNIFFEVFDVEFEDTVTDWEVFLAEWDEQDLY